MFVPRPLIRTMVVRRKTWGSPVRDYSSYGDAFAAELDDRGNLIWNTFLGGGGTDSGSAIAVDGSGNAYVVGSASSADFPTTADAYDTSPNGGRDAFVRTVLHFSEQFVEIASGELPFEWGGNRLVVLLELEDARF